MNMNSSTIVFLLSLTAIPISFLVNTFSYTHGEFGLFLSGTISLSGLCLIVYLCIGYQNNLNEQPYIYVFMLGTFSSACDILIALENDGFITGFFTFYLKNGEPYLKSAHGTMICYWDGIAHYAMYLSMLTAMAWSQNFNKLGLYWSGSIAHSILVFIPGNLIGIHSIKLSFLLNVPFVIFPFICGGNFLKNSHQTKISELKAKQIYISIWKRPIDMFLLCMCGLCVTFLSIRSLITMGLNHDFSKEFLDNFEPYIKDPHNYGKIQMHVHFFYFIPIYILIIFSLIYPGQSFVPDWITLLAGASAQGQFSYIGSALHHRTAFPLRASYNNNNFLYFIIFNLIVGIVPHLLLWRIKNNSDFFRKIEKKTEPLLSPRSPFLKFQEPFDSKFLKAD